MPEVATLTREKKHAVVASLARGRSIAMTAERCHVPAGVVQMLRDNYGPDLPRLEAAAHELAKFVTTPKITGRSTGHTAAQRDAAAALGPGEAKAVRAWAAANDVEVNPTGRPRTAVVDAWRAAGSPTTP